MAGEFIYEKWFHCYRSCHSTFKEKKSSFYYTLISNPLKICIKVICFPAKINVYWISFHFKQKDRFYQLLHLPVNMQLIDISVLTDVGTDTLYVRLSVSYQSKWTWENCLISAARLLLVLDPFQLSISCTMKTCCGGKTEKLKLHSARIFSFCNLFCLQCSISMGNRHHEHQLGSQREPP